MEYVLASHFAHLTRHCQEGQRINVSREATLTLIGSLQELMNIRSVRIDHYEVSIDYKTKTVKHVHHSDPAIPFDWNGQHCLQIFLYGNSLEDLTGNVSISFVDDTERQGIAIKKWIASRPISHQVIREGDIWKLLVDENEEIDIIFQRQFGGKEEETKITLNPGPQTLILRSQHAERLGICLSWADDPFGGIEFKHNLFGEVGMVSGRLVWSAGKIWLPTTPNTPRFRALVVNMTEGNFGTTSGFEEELKMATDIEIIVCNKNLEMADNIAKRYKNKVKTTKIGVKNDEFPKDITILKPDEQVVSNFRNEVSFLLFRDQADPTFKDDLRIILERFEKDHHIRSLSLERKWLDATETYLSKVQGSRYGIAWSTSSADARRGQINLVKGTLKLSEREIEKLKKIAASPFALTS